MSRKNHVISIVRICIKDIAPSFIKLLYRTQALASIETLFRHIDGNSVQTQHEYTHAT